MRAQIRAGLLVSLEPTVKRLGGDVIEVLRRAKLPPDMLANPEHYIPYTSYLQLLSSASQLTDCPHFGLEMSRELGAENMGVVGFVMTQAGNVGDAWSSLQRFYHVHDTYGSVMVTENDTMGCVRYEIPRAGLEGEHQSLDVAAGVSVNIHRMLCPRHDEITTIHFPYPKPDDLGPYEHLNCNNIMFNQPSYAMFFPAENLKLPVANSDPQMKLVLENFLRSLELSKQHATSRQVETLIREFLPVGNCTLARIAGFLSVSVRTLQNRLDSEHTSFQMLLDKVRHEQAIKHLSAGDMQLTQLAYLLGYSELSAFSRSFKRWYGTSPKQWQRLQPTPSSPK
ncbi:MAG: AraC family transcriptional regulator [Halioglobus sp.]